MNPIATTQNDQRELADGASSLVTIRDELQRITSVVADSQGDALDALVEMLDDARRIFLFGAGRSGLALQMTGMRLMHLGLNVHVVGDVTAPAIEKGDVLLTASGSGTTGSVVRAAEIASNVGARVATVSTAAQSPLAKLSAVLVLVPAAAKLDRTGGASVQYAGSLFEQTVVLLGDAVFDALWRRSGATADELWPRHANLE